jgi:alpha-1,3-mannosyltransferase
MCCILKIVNEPLPYFHAGDTGPLVYPAFFVYFYSALYFITSRGSNIRLAQYIFAGIYLLQIWLVLRLFSKARKVPPYLVVISIFTSYRVHSLYSLRLFNDPVAVLFFYAALNLLLDRRWKLGSVFYSLAVGIKMNILLFAPAILMLYLANLGIVRTIIQLSICAIVQLFIGAPFLLTHPVEYVKGSFDLGRIFEHKWTVNYRFLDRETFENKSFHFGLLIAHVGFLIIVSRPCFLFFKNYARLRKLQDQFEPQINAENREIEELMKKKIKGFKKKVNDEEEMTSEQKKFLKSFEKGLKSQFGDEKPVPLKEESKETPQQIAIHFDQCVQLALLPIFLVNFIGIMCARSLHYQFYVWYFHSLPYLSWFTEFHTTFKILILFLIEYCWNQYPSTNFSSVLLHACHTILFIGLLHKIFKEVNLAKKATSKCQ